MTYQELRLKGRPFKIVKADGSREEHLPCKDCVAVTVHLDGPLASAIRYFIKANEYDQKGECIDYVEE